MNESQEDIVIRYSARLAEALENKVDEHNENCPSNGVSLSQVIKVFKHGAETFPNEALGEIGINKWSLARVNMYLRVKCGRIDSSSIESVSNIKKEMSSLVFEKTVSKRVNKFLDVTENWIPNEEDFSLAQESVVKYDLDYNFNSLNDIYFAEKSKTEGLSFE
jgi:hypothetical protein